MPRVVPSVWGSETAAHRPPEKHLLWTSWRVSRATQASVASQGRLSSTVSGLSSGLWVGPLDVCIGSRSMLCCLSLYCLLYLGSGTLDVSPLLVH